MKELRIVGGDAPRVDARGKLAGALRYTADLRFPGMLEGKLLRAPHAHARILSVDASAAEALDGIFGVLTGRDLPVRYGILPVSQDETALAQDRVRYMGEPVAAVAARDVAVAEHALSLIKVKYEELPPVLDWKEALDPALPKLHEDSKLPANLHRVAALEFGDCEKNFQQADLVQEDFFLYGGNTHAALEPHASLALTEEGRLVVYSSNQAPHYLHRALAKVLDMPDHQIRVIAPPCGGGFGGKLDPFPQDFCAAALTLKTGRPVRFVLDREEVFYTHRGRHPMLMRLRSGFKKSGEITAMHLRVMMDGGACGSFGAACLYYAGALLPVTYRIPAYLFETMRLYTNKPPCGPKRGHGTPQPRTALETQMDKAAAKLGISPARLRRINLLPPHSVSVNHMRVTSSGLEECLRRVVEASGYEQKHGKLPYGEGVGIAVSSYVSGAALPIYRNDMPHSSVRLELHRSGGVTLYSGHTEIGQGADTMAASIAAETLGLPLEAVRVVRADSDLTPVDLGSYSSRVTMMVGNAVRRAAESLRGKLLETASVLLRVSVENLRLDGRTVRVINGSGDAAVPMDALIAAAEARHGHLSASGEYRPEVEIGPYKGSGVGPSPAYSFAACALQLKVNPHTGEVDVRKVWLAHDIGKCINRLLVEGQVEGGVYMALGEALYESQDFTRGGLHRSPSLLEYKTPAFTDMPEVVSILVESEETEGPFGAKEAGQGPLLPVMAALLNALDDAIGVRVDETPATPEKILRALEAKHKGQASRHGPEAMPDFAWPEPEKVPPGGSF